MINKVIKRSGILVKFDSNKIFNAVLSAMKAVDIIDEELAKNVVSDVVSKIDNKIDISVEEIQDLVEEMLVTRQANIKIIREYITYRFQRKEVRDYKEALGILGDDGVKLTTNAITLLEERYLKNIGNKKETPTQMFMRTAKHIAAVEKRYGESSIKWTKIFYNMLCNGIFMPNMPTLSNSGIKDINYLPACFTLSVDDSMEDIFNVAKDMAIIFKAGGGVGLNLSNLRPRNDIVKTTGKYSSGVVGFLPVYNAVVESVKQGGMRRGAALGLLRVDHPDIVEFITCKKQEGTFSNFNFSVAITDKFMQAITRDLDFNLINPRNKEKVSSVRARYLFNLIAQNAWETGEPGIVFFDTCQKNNPVPSLGYTYKNACLTGDTLIAVADGREAVSIQQLAEDGQDVPVYCADDRGWKHIRYARNPRKTGSAQAIYEVVLDDGSSIKATNNHRFVLVDGSTKCVCDLIVGDSLLRFDYGDLQRNDHIINHKVVSINFIGYEDVYNLTVDEFHNYAVITNDGNDKKSGIIVKNCGETDLQSGESCVLGSINLTKFIDGDNILWKSLSKTVSNSVRFLDNVIDATDYPLSKIKEATQGNRKIGIGVMGFADILYMLGISYNSDRAVELADKIMEFIYVESKKASEQLAIDRGTFPNYNISTYTTPIRNASFTVIAPTGEISILANCSPGIEPNFGLVFKRQTTLLVKELITINPIFESVAKKKGFYSVELINKIISNNGRVCGISEVPVELQKIFITALEVSPEYHIKIQAAFQKHVDNSVSKTINLPNNTTVADVEKIIKMSYESNCNGVTVFRDGCRKQQVVSVGSNLCPECKVSLIFSEGCFHCPSCGWGKCSI